MSDEQGKPPAGTPPADDDKGESGKTPKMLTEDEAKELADRKLRGVLKEHEKDKKRLAALEAEEERRKQASLSESEKYAKTNAELEELRQRLKARDEADQTELAEIEDENKATIRALKKDHPDFADLVPEGLAPKALAKWLARIRDKLGTKTLDVHGGGGRATAPRTPEEEQKAGEEKLLERGRAFVFGSPKEKK